jgi:hypothetical protein
MKVASAAGDTLVMYAGKFIVKDNEKFIDKLCNMFKRKRLNVIRSNSKIPIQVIRKFVLAFYRSRNSHFLKAKYYDNVELFWNDVHAFFDAELSEFGIPYSDSSYTFLCSFGINKHTLKYREFINPSARVSTCKEWVIERNELCLVSQVLVQPMPHVFYQKEFISLNSNHEYTGTYKCINDVPADSKLRLGSTAFVDFIAEDSNHEFIYNNLKESLSRAFSLYGLKFSEEKGLQFCNRKPSCHENN